MTETCSRDKVAGEEEETVQAVTPHRPTALAAAFSALAWLGEFVHNLVELPQLSPLDPQNSLPALVFAVLFAAWWLFPAKRIMPILIIVWAVLHLVGGAIITVIPFSFLPFYPEQSLRHYLAHISYGLAQLPLMILMVLELRRAR
jgi:hypothetical protein